MNFCRLSLLRVVVPQQWADVLIVLNPLRARRLAQSLAPRTHSELLNKDPLHLPANIVLGGVRKYGRFSYSRCVVESERQGAHMLWAGVAISCCLLHYVGCHILCAVCPLLCASFRVLGACSTF